MPAFDVEGARVVVVGAARSGVAAAVLLVRRGAHVILTDMKMAIPDADLLQEAGVTLALGSTDIASASRADLVVMSPGVPLSIAGVADARARGVPVIGEMELASRWVRGRIVAITGTKGKSTTTTLVGRMLATAGRRVLVGGNIGVPLSSQVDDSTDDTVHVVEASSFQLETTTTFHPWIAALLNVSADHLDRHASEAEYAGAKARVFANQTPDDWAVVNADNPPAVSLAAGSRARRLLYGVEHRDQAAVVVEDDVIWRRTDGGRTPLLPLSAIRLAGRHMVSNVAGAAAISHAAGVDSDAMRRAVEGFTGLEHVMEPAGAWRGVRFVNDSKATNVDAAARSIESFDGVVAIVGGRYKGGTLDELGGPLARQGRGVVAIGEARRLVTRVLAPVVPVREAESMAEAVGLAYELAQPDGVVLLAPACASFDMFTDYAHRGRVFKEEVRKLIERETQASSSPASEM
jgi:UDP-N-acetylmuramoylalanine--D-glutamate ligase